MWRTLKYFFMLIGLVLVGLWGYGQYEQYSHPYRKHQVRRLPAEPPTGQILAIERHLALTPRPADPYPFPIPLGEVGPRAPLYAGAPQYPFFCMTLFSGLGQPLVDNQAGEGVAVYREVNGEIGDEVIGYSRDCLLPTRLHYYYGSQEGEIRPLPESEPGAPWPEDVAMIAGPGGPIPEIYRVESGTINRYPYYIVMLATPDQPRDHAPHWDRRLIYQLHGGSGIGFRQGRLGATKVITKRRDQLRQGAAVITSTANKTSYTYNILLAEDTARRVKRQFVSLYGAPRYTLGIGGSGGGLSQYLMMQNNSGLLDGALALYAYPDMVSQTLYGLDCDLLNTYYAFRSRDPEEWQDFDQRAELEGLNAVAGFDQRAPFLEPLNQLIRGRWPYWPQGSSECINGWFGLSALIHNPRQGYLRPMFSEAVQRQTHWSHWEDLHQIYGRDPAGFARTAWGNVGVQYGLEALKAGTLSVEEFLHLNQRIGGWVDPEAMEAERIWAPLGKVLPLWLTLWGNHNVSDGRPAARTQGDPLAIERAYRSGLVFLGRNPLPVIDLRHYLDEQLDMHHLSASFEARARIDQWQGHHDNQLIWVADHRYTPLEEAFEAMDLWLTARQRGEARPRTLDDRCFGADGQILAQGEGVWDGSWNGREEGACTRRFTSYSNARIQSGGPWAGSIFRCRRIPVDEAMAAGIYGDLDMSPWQEALASVFPDGVCDYRQGDDARPSDLNPGAF